MSELDEVIEALHGSRQGLFELLTEDKLGRFVNEGTGRRVGDVACHVAQWERSVGFSMEVSLLGGVFHHATQFDIHDINDRIFHLHRDKNDDQLRALLASSREQFVSLLEAVAPDAQVLLPWGRSETPVEIARDMLGHERHHEAQIRSACTSE